MPLSTTVPRPPLTEQSFRRTLRQTSTALTLALAIPALALLGLVFVLLRAAHWVDHTDRVIARVSEVLNLAVDMETGLRGAQLTADKRFLAPYHAAQSRIDDEVAALQKLVSDNSAQSARVAGLRGDLAAWRQFADTTLERERAGVAAVRSADHQFRGKQLMDTVRRRVADLLGEETRLRVARDRRLDRVVAGLLTLLGFGVLGGIPGLIVWFRRQQRRVVGSYITSLADSEEQRTELRVTLHSIGDAVIATDATGAITFLNPIAERLCGWSDAEARGRLLLEVFPIFSERTGSPAENPVERVLREKIIVELANHTVLRPRAGGEIPIEDSAAPIFRADGSLRGVILVFYDVTEKHARERELRAAEWLARSGLEIVGAGAWVWEIERDRVFGDALMARIFGVPLARCQVGEPIASFFAAVHADDRPRVQQAVSRALESGEFYAAEYRVIGEDGRERWVDGRGRIERDDTGRPMRMPGVLTDITARREAEDALRLARDQAETALRSAAEGAERFRLLAESVSLQVWTATPDGLLDWANHYVVNYFGVADVERDVLGNAWTQLVHADDLPHAGARWAHSLRSGERYETEFRLRRGDGEYRWFLVRAEAVRGATSEITRWFGTNTEIHDLKAAQQNAEAASRAKDNFLAALSHELRTPLTPVLMTAAALREDDRLPDDAREQLGMMERNIALEARLIDDLLDLTRITQGKLSLRVQPCDAHSLIGLAVEIVRSDAQVKGIAIERDFEAVHSGLVADPARFQQVMWNLLRNSVKFTPPGGRIGIRTSNAAAAGQPPRLRIEVTDSGIGIAPDAIDLIFRPFEQAGVGQDHRFGGLGLGLAIARAIVDLHGGTIRAESVGTGQGATFIVELPDAIEPPHGVAEMSGQAGSPRTASQRSMHILLVEDHVATHEVLSRLLTRAGHRVVVAESVAAALAAAENHSFDFVISDLGLPDGTGTELMTQLHTRHGLSGIALSGYGMEQDMERTREAGFLTHLVKPVDFNQLRRALESV